MYGRLLSRVLRVQYGKMDYFNSKFFSVKNILMNRHKYFSKPLTTSRMIKMSVINLSGIRFVISEQSSFL